MLNHFEARRLITTARVQATEALVRHGVGRPRTSGELKRATLSHSTIPRVRTPGAARDPRRSAPRLNSREYIFSLSSDGVPDLSAALPQAPVA